MELRPIAVIRTDFSDKFGIPRQSGLVPALTARIVPEPDFRTADAFRGIEQYSHLWLLWQFSTVAAEYAAGRRWRPTVRPPRLGGNTRMGVFATRSPFRPNSLGLSCVRLLNVEETKEFGTVLHVGGADLMDGTPIFDIKPYIPYSDAFPEALGGFTDHTGEFLLDVEIPSGLLAQIPAEKRQALLGVLRHDPRPSYQRDPERVYGLTFAGYNIRFRVTKQTLTV